MISFLKTVWKMLVEWGEEVYDYRKKNRFMGMY